MPNPTIVSASLDDKELQQSIANLVAHVKRGLHTMLTDTNSTVDAMEKKLKSLGNLKIDSNGTADGGASKRAKAQNAETDAVEKTIAARDKQIKQNKEVEMSFDQIAAALSKARRTVSEFNTSRASGILPSSEDYKRYEQALSRIVEYNDKLKQSASAMADANQKAFSFDGRRLLKDAFSTDDRLKQLNKYYAEQEKLSQKAIQDEERQRQKRVAAMEKESAAQKKMIDDQYRLSFARTMKIPTDQLDLAQAKLERLQALLRDMRERGILSNTQIASTEAEIRKLEQIIGQANTAQQQTTQSAQRYTEEIRKQAQAIRESQQWKEKGFVTVGDINYYDKERANVSKRDKQLLLSLEEQIVQAQQKEAQEALVAAEAKRQQAQAAKEAAQASKGVSAYDLGIDPSVSVGRQRQIESTRAASKETEYLKQQVASLLEVEEREIKTANTTSSSYAQLAQYLKHLQSAYQRLGADRIAKGEGTDLANEIQKTQRAMQKLQQTMSRPVSLKDALGGSEKTLDDIAYKMRQLASYRSGLNVDTQKKEIQQVNDEYNRLKKRMDEVMQKNQQMIASNTALGRSWNYMKNRLAFYFTVGASTSFIKNLIEVRSQYEMNERALGILVNSAERGTQIFNELSQMALVSPYTLIELSAAAKQLTAYDVAAKDVVDTTRRLADMAAAVGIPIERLTYALGQIKAYGYLNARDARMFANAGIPLVKQLSEYYTELEGRLVSTADIYDRIKKKSIGYEEVTSVIAKMTDEGGKFYDFQAKMAETLKVQLANLTLAWNNMLNAMGEESQGVLVGGISTLKQFFLHWKDIEHVLYELVVALGAYKAYQIITTRLMGATAASLDAQVLAMKRNKAAMLEKQALTRKLTVDELRQVAAQNQVTAADYRNALSGKQLTKQKALLLVALNKNNVQLKAAVVNMGLLTTQEVANITTGKALAIVFKSIGISIRSAALAIKAFAASMWPLLVIGAIYELYHAWDSYGEHVKEVNKQAAEHAKEAFENIKQYLESDVTSALRDRLDNGGKVENDAAGQKAWDEMREKIELSSSASNAFIAKLMQINDINERLSTGFGYLEDIQRVAGVMQTLGDDAIEVSTTTLGGLFGEGLKDDLTDFINAYQKYISLNENLRQGGVGEKYFNDQKRALEEFRGEVEKTTKSLYNIASKEGFNTNEQREFFEREISEIAQAEQMGAKETRIFRMQAEKEYYAYARAQLVSQLEYQDGAQKALTQKRINDLDNEFGTNKSLQESFFTWLTEKQDHAVKNMLRGKTQEEIKQGEWLKDSNAKWVEEMARKFSKEYGVSFDDLHRLVLNANTWSINIPVFFQTIGQPLSDVQRDYEARTGKKFSSNPIIKDAKTQVEIIDTLKKKQKEVANEMETARKAGGKYWEDNKQRYKEENDALVADIHAYNALTDAEEKANKKSGKGSKKDPLLDALKQEISLVEKLQSDYDKLSKSGASQADALDTIRGAYGKTIRLLNAQLDKYGLPQLDISQLITGKDPNKALAHFKQTLNTLVSKGMLTLERSKELEAVVEKFTLSAKTYNLDMITKGLNNELGKLKDEYELAVELDANPEMGNVFTEMFGLDTTDFPRTIGDYMNRVQQEFDKARMNLNLGTSLNVFKANTEQWYDWGKAVEYSKEQVDNFKKSFDSSIGVAKKWAQDVVKQTQDLQYKLADNNGKIAIEEEKLAVLRQRLAQETNDKQKALLELQIQDQQNAIAKLKEELLQLLPTYQRLFGEVAEHSAWMTRKLAKDYKNMLVEGKNRGLNADNTYSVRDPISGQISRISKERMGKEIKNADKELQKTQSTIKKITEAFTKGEDGVVDWVHGVQLIGEELGKLGNLVDVVGQIADAFGNPDEYNATAEAFHDIATSLQGAATATQGIGQFASGDYIGGAASILSGVFSTVSAWMDNSDKNISAQVKKSERAVKRLENEYKKLQQAINDAYGVAEIGAKRAAIANKEIQLLELKRQLQLEESRKSKNKDADKIEDLKGQIIDLELEIKNATREIVSDLTGITSVGDAAESMVLQMIEAFKKGEDYMGKYSETFEDMIDNMIMKAIVGKVIGEKMQEIFDRIQEIANKRADQTVVNVKDIFDDTGSQWVRGWINEGMYFSSNDQTIEQWRKGLEQIMSRNMTEEGKKVYGDALEKLNKLYSDNVAITPYDVSSVKQEATEMKDDAKKTFDAYMDAFGILFGQDSTKELSALQQGIQGITEDTAGALESYMNIVSQRIFEQGSLIREIRDVVVGFDADVQVATQAQMLLQLQQSYAVQMAIQGILEGWNNPSGQAVRVELVS